MIGRERALQKALLPVRNRYDYILIDTPPSLGLLTINALTAADNVIVPVQCEYLSLRGLVQLENTLSMIRENLNPTVEIRGILPTMYDGRTLHSKEAVEMLKENFGELVFETRIRKTVRYAEAPVQGSSVLKYDPDGAAPPRPTATSRRRCSMARRRASMREGPLAELFRATEAAQRQSEKDEPGAGRAAAGASRPRRHRRVRARPSTRPSRSRPSRRGRHRRRAPSVRAAAGRSGRAGSRAPGASPEPIAGPARAPLRGPRRAAPGARSPSAG